MSCTSCQMRRNGSPNDGGDRLEAAARKVAAKAGMQARAAAAPSADDHVELPPERERAGDRLARLYGKPAAPPPEPPVLPPEPMRDDPAHWRKPPPVLVDRVKHEHATANLWHEPVTWLAGALVLSAIVGAATTVYLHHAGK